MSNNDQLLPCPCCGSGTIGKAGAYDVCDICGWEDDPVQSADPTYAGGANAESLDMAREHRWQKLKLGDA